MQFETRSLVIEEAPILQVHALGRSFGRERTTTITVDQWAADRLKTLTLFEG